MLLKQENKLKLNISVSIEIKSRMRWNIMLFETLKRAIIRGNYTSKKDMGDKLSLLYSADKINDEQYIDLVFLLEGGEE